MLLEGEAKALGVRSTEPEEVLGLAIRPGPSDPSLPIRFSRMRAAGARPSMGIRDSRGWDLMYSPALMNEGQRKEIWAVGGGKGGIGKSLIVSNMSIVLAQRGKKVVLIDADLGGANLHTCLGISPPKVTLGDFMTRRVEKMEEVIVDTGIPNLGLISGAQEILWAANPKHAQKMRLLKTIRTLLNADYILMDLGSGTSYNILDFFLISDHGLLVVIPEPTSIENAYRFLKFSFLRKLQNLAAHHHMKELIDSALDQKSSRGIRTPFDLFDEIGKIDGKAGELLQKDIEGFRPKLILNQIRSETDIRIGFAIRSACTKYLGIQIEYLGYIYYDDFVWQSIRKKRPLVLDYPQCIAAQGIRSAAEKLLR